MENTERSEYDVLYDRRAKLAALETEVTESANNTTLYDAGVKAILSVLQNHVETALKTSEMSERVGGRTERYISFKDRLKEKSGRNIDLILSGSISQRLVAFHWIYPTPESGLFGRKAAPDIDVLIVDKSYTVSEAESFKQGSCLLMKPTSNPGYVRLFKGASVRSRCISSKGFRKYWRGLVDQVELFTRYTGRGNRFPGRGKTVTGPAVTRIENVSSRDFFDHDFVPSLRCSSWPSEAKEWLTRQRKSGWPSEELIKRCFDSSCLVVPVGPKECSRASKSKEWRLSFTEPELYLARSLNDKPRQAYVLTKLLIKTAIQELRKTRPFLKNVRLISSYDIKTAMFWLCEKKSTWGNMLDDIKLLFKALQGHFKEGNLPDYFIPEKNIIAGISDTALNICLTVLQELQGFPLLIIKQCFVDAFGSLLQFDEEESPLLRRIYEEMCVFSDTNVPTKKLLILVLMRLLLELFYADLHAQIKEDVNVRMKPCVDNMSVVQLDFIHLLHEEALFDVTKLDSYSKSPVSFERLEYISNFFLESMCNHTVVSVLHDHAFAILAAFVSQHVLFASTQFLFRKEVIDFAELVEENIENEKIRQLAEQSHGSVEKLLQTAGDIEDEVEELDWIFSQTAETALKAYYKLMEQMGILDKSDFHCHDEKVIVEICTIVEDRAPGILEEESSGTDAARRRLQVLIENFDKNDLHHRIG